MPRYEDKDFLRTKAAEKRHPDSIQDGIFCKSNHQGPVVSGKTRDFLTQTLFSCGTGDREIIKYDPKSNCLDEKYTSLKEKIQSTKLHENEHLRNIQIFQLILQVAKNTFPNAKADHEMLNAHRGEVLALDDIMSAGNGVCRHHSLLTCYLLSRLIGEKFLSQGDVIHHRQDYLNRKSGRDGAHTWVLFKCQGQLYSIDTLNGHIDCLTDGSKVKHFMMREDSNLHEMLLQMYHANVAPQQKPRTPQQRPDEQPPVCMILPRIDQQQKQKTPQERPHKKNPVCIIHPREPHPDDQSPKEKPTPAPNAVQKVIKPNENQIKNDIAAWIAKEYKNTYGSKPGFFYGSSFSSRFYLDDTPTFDEIIDHVNGNTIQWCFFKANGTKTNTLLNRYLESDTTPDEHKDVIKKAIKKDSLDVNPVIKP